ncbi:MAG: hypothetical protein IJS59_04910 [Bacteroidaceae bacterium]|nr:hypothetical protein [Bacteroidaceae bacterium]
MNTMSMKAIAPLQNLTHDSRGQRDMTKRGLDMPYGEETRAMAPRKKKIMQAIAPEDVA